MSYNKLVCLMSSKKNNSFEYARTNEQKERSYPESNRGRPDVLHHEAMSIRTGSDNRYTIEPFLVHRSELSQSMVLGRQLLNIYVKHSPENITPKIDGVESSIVSGRRAVRSMS